MRNYRSTRPDQSPTFPSQGAPVKSLLLAFACLLSCPAFAQAEAGPTDTPVQQIEAVIEAFRTAIIDKDKGRFASLFLHENITWQDVTGDANLKKLREKRPEARKVRVDPKDNYMSFI